MSVPRQQPPWDTEPHNAIASALHLMMRQTQALEDIADRLDNRAAGGEPPPPGTCGALVVTRQYEGSIAEGQMCRRVDGACPWPKWTRPGARVDYDLRCAWERETGGEL